MSGFPPNDLIFFCGTPFEPLLAAHSFVNSDVPKNEIWAGIPAKFKKKLND